MDTRCGRPHAVELSEPTQAVLRQPLARHRLPPAQRAEQSAFTVLTLNGWGFFQSTSREKAESETRLPCFVNEVPRAPAGNERLMQHSINQACGAEREQEVKRRQERSKVQKQRRAESAAFRTAA